MREGLESFGFASPQTELGRNSIYSKPGENCSQHFIFIFLYGFAHFLFIDLRLQMWAWYALNSN